MSRKEYEQTVSLAVGLAFVKAWSKRWVWLEDGRGWVCTEHGIKWCPPCTELAIQEDQHNQSK